MVVSPSTLNRLKHQLGLERKKKIKRLLIKYQTIVPFLLISSNGKEWQGKVWIFWEVGIGTDGGGILPAWLAKVSPFITVKKIQSPGLFFTPASLLCVLPAKEMHQQNSSRCAEKQKTHGSQQTGVSLFYLKTVLHYHLQRVRKGFPPCLEFIKASNMINNLYTWIVIQKKKE